MTYTHTHIHTQSIHIKAIPTNILRKSNHENYPDQSLVSLNDILLENHHSD